MLYPGRWMSHLLATSCRWTMCASCWTAVGTRSLTKFSSRKSRSMFIPSMRCYCRTRTAVIWERCRIWWES
uniref:Putative secreted protein n=1 Tax=Anopheles darlingi TaxID=43151 RepID=A0A2M4DAQ4_ANODA